MKNQKKKSFPRRVFLWLLAILLAVCIAFGVYVSDYYHRRPRRRGRAGGMDESSIKSKNIPTIFLYVTGEWPGLFLLFREPALNTNGTYG